MSEPTAGKLVQNAINDILDSKKEKYDKQKFSLNQNVYDEILYTFEILERFKMGNFYYVDDTDLHDAAENINNLKNILDELSEKKQSTSPQNLKNVGIYTRKIINFFIMWCVSIRDNKKYLVDLKENIKNKFDTLEDETQKRLKKLEELSTQAEDKINKFESAMQTLAGERAVEFFSGKFEESARKNAKNAKFWGWVLVVLAAITALVVGWIFWTTIDGSCSNVSLQIIASRAIVIIVCMSAALWCGRIYKSEKHQQSINEHNKNIMISFKAFMSASSYPVHTSVILWEATRTVFGEFNTGYFNFDKKSNDNIIVDVLKNMVIKHQG